MPHRSALATLVAATAALLLAVGCAPDPRPAGPNVLWICVDVLRADRLGAYGYEKPTSPRLDRLAAQGVLFRDAYAQSSWTAPSVPSFLTSSYPVQHGVLQASTQDRAGRIVSDVLAPERTTAAELFRDGGYATGGFVTNAQLRDFLGYAQGFDVYAEELGRAREINATFLDWVDDAERPFFAYLHYLDVHWPYRPAPEHLAHFPSPPTDLPFTGPEAPALLDRINAGRVAIDDDDRAALVARYDATVRQVDAAVDALLAELERRGLGERTLVVVSADHGEELFEHGLIGHGRSLRDTLLHVPLLLAGPGVPEGRVVDAPVESLDILPTLLELASLPVPDTLRGQSLVPAMRAEPAASPETDEAPRPVFAQLMRRHSFHRSVRAGPWKLVEDYHLRERGTAQPHGRLDLEPGERVKLRGAFRGETGFLAADFEVDEGGPEVVLRGPIDRLDLDAGLLAIGPIHVELPDGVSWRKRDQWLPLDPQELAEGALVEVDGRVAGPRRVRAEKVELRVDEREALQVKLEVRVEAVAPEVPPSLRALGLDVRFEGDVPLPGIVLPGEEHGTRPLDEASLRNREVARREVSLYHVATDPHEREDVADAHPDVVEALAALLSEGPATRAAGGAPAGARRSLDAETVERLRALGYVEEPAD